VCQLHDGASAHVAAVEVRFEDRGGRVVEAPVHQVEEVALRWAGHGRGEDATGARAVHLLIDVTKGVARDDAMKPNRYGSAGAVLLLCAVCADGGGDEVVLHAELGAAIQLPARARVIARSDEVCTYAAPLPGGDEMTVALAPVHRTLATLDDVLTEAESLGAARIVSHTSLGAGRFLVVEAPRGDRRAVWSFVPGAAGHVRARCRAPADLLHACLRVVVSLAPVDAPPSSPRDGELRPPRK
jgi:hypothetical protein